MMPEPIDILESKLLQDKHRLFEVILFDLSN